MSEFLFARPSVLEGIARNSDLFGTMQVYNESKNPPEADQRAIKNDWTIVGSDLMAIFKRLEAEINRQ